MMQAKLTPISAIVFSLLVIAFLVALFIPVPQPDLGDATYTSATVLCAPEAKAGAAGFTDNRLTKNGIRYHVRTPQNYDKRNGHPLLLVLSPGDRSGLDTERFTGLTTEATRAGFVVAYADNRPRTAPSQSRPISKQWILELGTIPGRIAADWCIDTKRVFLVGHSNGGTASLALSVLPNSPFSPTAIAISGAGFQATDLAEMSCPLPKPVMVMHSRDDNLFPGYGTQIANWWAKCNRCEGADVATDIATTMTNGGYCHEFSGCAAKTLFCPGTGPHIQWPGRNREILDFLRTVK
jgi:polyhydroxybutyrate depolymerase